MTIIRVLKNWNVPDLMRQTPSNKGIWNDNMFTTDPIKQVDYVIVLNNPQKDTWVSCPRQHIWAIMQEPPTEFFRLMHRGDPSYYRIFTSDELLIHPKYTHSHPALPWHINKDFDYLKNCRIPQKSQLISSITSNKIHLRGQRDRLKFLAKVKESIEFDQFGRGIKFIPDKWDGLAPYQYSLVIENYSNRYYWSEKLADCFLSWTMPIYYGCTQINDYFPEEALIRINIHDENSIDIIKDSLAKNLWKKNIDAISFARQLILDKYQFFPFIENEIQNHRRSECNHDHICNGSIYIPEISRINKTIADRIKDFWRFITPKKFRRSFAKIRQKLIE
jgi:hypothetical protein